MFIDYSNMLNEMCGALPVSAEDARGIAEAVERLKQRHAEPVSGFDQALDEICTRLLTQGEQLSRELIEQARSEAVGG